MSISPQFLTGSKHLSSGMTTDDDSSMTTMSLPPGLCEFARRWRRHFAPSNRRPTDDGVTPLKRCRSFSLRKSRAFEAAFCPCLPSNSLCRPSNHRIAPQSFTLPNHRHHAAHKVSSSTVTAVAQADHRIAHHRRTRERRMPVHHL